MRVLYDVYRTEDKLFNAACGTAENVITIFHIISGYTECITENRTYDLKKDTLCIIGSGNFKISGAADERCLMRGVSLSREFIDKVLYLFDKSKYKTMREILAKGLYGRELTPRQTETMNEIFTFSVECADTGSLKTLSKLIELLSIFIDKEEEDLTKNVLLRDELVVEVLNYVNNHVYENITIENMAKELFVSKRYLLYKFKEVTGVTVKKYIYNKRMETAKRLLTETDFSIDEISGKVGYETVSGFSRAYKEFSGLTPKRYRDKVSEKKQNNKNE